MWILANTAGGAENAFFQDFVVIMVVAGIVTVLFHFLKQPAILGYLVAGVLVGPHVIPGGLIQQKETLHSVADLGVIFLMFSLGLHFSFRKLTKVGGKALTIGLLEAPFVFAVGFASAKWLGWSFADSIFIGASLCISSTILMFKTLSEMGKMNAPFARIVFGVGIVEDLIAISLLAILPSIVSTGTFSLYSAASIGLKLAAFFVSLGVVGLLVAPRFVDHLDRYQRQDVLMIGILALCFGGAYFAYMMGYSVALGAFLTGSVIAESKAAERINFFTKPISDLFGSLFFVAIGMMWEPDALATSWEKGLIILGVFLVVKIGMVSLAAMISGENGPAAFRTGFSMGQIGEFSFVMAALGLQLGVMRADVYPMIIGISVVTMFVSPFVLKHADRMIDPLWNRVPLSWRKELDLYHQWLGQLAKVKNPQQAAFRGLTIKIVGQLTINFAIITTLFLLAAYLMRNTPEWVPFMQELGEWKRAIFWMVTMTIGLPVFVATYRKMQAFSMLLAEMSMQNASHTLPLDALRSGISRAILITGTLILIAWILIFSSALLPPLRILMVAVASLGVIVLLLRQHFIKIYARAQMALVETLSEPQDMDPIPDAEEVMPTLLRGMDVEVLTLKREDWVAGRMLKDLELRNKTGANIIGIERAEQSIINPRATELILPEDRILLVGTKHQLSLANQYLREGEVTA
ncbi:MAG: cation:proton antiporter [Verrucomicrobiota bacterium]